MAMEKTVVRDDNEQRREAMISSAVFRTPHYAVLISKLTGGPETFDQLRTRYVIVSIEHGIILGNTSSLGQAMMACLQEEAVLIQAKQIAMESAERGYIFPVTDSSSIGEASPVKPASGAPRF
jgi:hypothetical protein